MKIKSTIWLVVFVILLLPVGCAEDKDATSAQIQEPVVGTVVEVVPENSEIKVGENTQVAVNIKQVSNLYGIEVHIDFDADRLLVIDADPQENGVQVTPGHFLQPDFIAENQVALASGTLDYVAVQMPPHEAVNGQGTLLTFEVQGKAPGEADITLTQALLATSDGEPIPAVLQGGTLIVNAKQ